MRQDEIEAQVLGDAMLLPRSRAQRIYLASILLLRRLRQANIVIPDDVSRAFNARVERWCVEAQVQSPA